MPENIVIRLFADSAKPVEWLYTDSSGARHGAPSSGPLSAAAAAAVDHRVLVMLPSSEVLITAADVPAKGSRLLQALPFALEEQLADDIENLHFAAGTRRSNGLTPVIVVEKKRFEEYRNRLTNEGLTPAAIYSEIQGLARIPGTISILLEDGDVIINDGADVELALQQISPGDALVAIGALDDTPDAAAVDASDHMEQTVSLPRHLLVYCNEVDNERYANEWLVLRNELDSVETRLLPDGSLPRLAATVSTGKAINLLQGDYAISTSMAASWKPWRNVALLLLAVGLIGIVGRVTEYFSLKRQDQRLQVAVEEQFRKTLPWIQNIRNPQAQLQGELNRMGAPDASSAATDFMDTLAALSSAMKSAPGSKIEGISFRSGETDIQLTVPNVATLEKLQKSVSESSTLEATIDRADKQGGVVKSRITIKASGV